MKKICNLYKITFALNLLIICAVFIGNFLYQKSGFPFALKQLCSMGFVAVGAIALIYALISKQKNIKFHLAIAIGLISAFLGDVLIDRNFIVGAGLFAAGHIFFTVAYCFFQKPTLRDLVVALTLCCCAVAFLLFYPDFDFESDIFKFVCIAYAFIISSMLGKSLTSLISAPSPAAISMFTGSFLFFASDLMLVFAWFSSIGNWANNACMALYYPGVCLIAFASLLKCTKR